MTNTKKTIELENKELEKVSGGRNSRSISTVVKNLEKNDSYFDGVFLYVVAEIRLSGHIRFDKYEFSNGKYIFMSSGNALSENELLEMEYKGKFKG